MTLPLRHPLCPAPLRLGLLTPHDPFDTCAFSGTPHFAARALDARADVTLLTPGHRKPAPLDLITGRRRQNTTSGDLAACDAILGLVATDLLDRNDLPKDVPVIHVTDATPAFLRDAYGWDIPRAADAAEARVLSRTDAAVYSSGAMAARARAEFGVAPHVLSFGVNLANLPAHCPEKPGLDRIELVLVASEWIRKGGPFALSIMDRLARAGRAAHLTVVGDAPRALARRPDVTRLGWLDKTRPRDARRLAAALSRAHLALVPSRADCTPMTVAEAMAHGTPVIAADTGGMATLLPEGAPGRRMPLDAGSADWARAVTDLTRDDWVHATLSSRAFDDARARLSWDAWAEGIVALARDLVLLRSVQAA